MTDTRPDRPDRAAANERQRRYQQRLAGLLPPVPRCVDCGCQATAADPDEAQPRCSRCWRRTDEGREWNRARMCTVRLISRINRILSEPTAMTLPPVTEPFIHVNSRSGAIGRLRWSNSDPSGTDACLTWPRWGSTWFSTQWFKSWTV